MGHIMTDNADRGISLEEVESIFKDERRKYIPAKRKISESRYICIGLSNQYRLITVIFTFRNGKIRPITARKPREKEVEAYFGAEA